MLELDLNREGERYVMNGIALMHKRVHHFISLLKKHVTYVLSSGGSTTGQADCRTIYKPKTIVHFY